MKLSLQEKRKVEFLCLRNICGLHRTGRKRNSVIRELRVWVRVEYNEVNGAKSVELVSSWGKHWRGRNG